MPRRQPPPPPNIIYVDALRTLAHAAIAFYGIAQAREKGSRRAAIAARTDVAGTVTCALLLSSC